AWCLHQPPLLTTPIRSSFTNPRLGASIYSAHFRSPGNQAALSHYNYSSTHHLHRSSLILTAMASTDSWTHEIESPVAAARLFRAGVMDWHTLAPKLAPHIVASAHPVEGEGGIGSIRQFNFTSGTTRHAQFSF
uniref:Uncharacterized protein n=1 Tax=Aegilops tauschii subsp. strangulata TaxID=200361 RepID=A0A453C3N5_AEGTS